jgi:hypothetical protein
MPVPTDTRTSVPSATPAGRSRDDWSLVVLAMVAIVLVILAGAMMLPTDLGTLQPGDLVGS